MPELTDVDPEGFALGIDGEECQEILEVTVMDKDDMLENLADAMLEDGEMNPVAVFRQVVRYMQASAGKSRHIPPEATPEQVKWVMARMMCASDQEAALMIGISPRAPAAWKIKTLLDRAVKDLLLEDAGTVTIGMLQAASMAAVATLVKEMLGGSGGRERVNAANSILDRVGIVRGMNLSDFNLRLGEAGGRKIVVRDLVGDDDK